MRCRVVIIAFALVIAYPYIPGSDSAAFKGVSVFLGVILSLGSSSFIGNMIAGLSMTYRGAFKEGDRIKVGEVVGTVEDIKLMVTRVLTPKNERVIMPNSIILNTDVVNYSQMAREKGLVLHSTVGIGYDTPWRHVEAMLVEAAARTVASSSTSRTNFRAAGVPRSTGSATASCGGAAGNRMRKVVPWFGAVSSWTKPSWPRTIPSTAARPSPRPANFVEKNGSNILCTVSGSMPHPVSETSR